MDDAIPTSANEFIEQQLCERLGGIEQSFESDALSIVGALIGGVDDLIRVVIEDLRRKAPPQANLVVLLTTNGGYIEVVDRIVSIFRHQYKGLVRFVIPNYAFSAGTVLALSGDDIYMDYYSRLGPIDPQVPTARGTRLVPALGYLIQWERLIKKAQEGTLTLPEVQLMIEGFDQAELYAYEQARKLSIKLLEEWLATYKFKNWEKTETRKRTVTRKMRKDRAARIASELNNTERWLSHGYGISMEVLHKDLDLRINNLDNDDGRCDQIKKYSSLLSDFMAKLGHRGVLHTVRGYRPFM